MGKEMVSQSFRQLMKLAAMGAAGKRTDIAEVDWHSVLCFAEEQAVLPIVACSLLVQPEIICPEPIKERLLERMRAKSGSNYVRKMRILHLIHEMEANGIDAKLIKGYVVGLCYAYPDCRISSDTDIFVPLEQEESVCEYLRSKGFRIDLRGETDHHDVGQHPKLGVVEIHVHLYNELRREVWFRDVEEDALLKEAHVHESIADMPYTTIGYTDHLIFLTLHLIEHFICTGMGLRMMLDIALFFSKHKTQIDAQRYWRLMENLKFATLVRCILWALIDTGCFEAGDFPGLSGEKPEGIDLLLNDLELGGHMGVKGEQQFDASYEYNRQVILRTKSPAQYRMYMLKHKIRSAKKQMFPKREQLIKLYPKLENKRGLLFFARIHRVFMYPILKIRAGALHEQIRSDMTGMPEESRRRMDMFKALDMI